eukprot:12890128-Prorocentrum_lima.AAC.1
MTPRSGRLHNSPPGFNGAGRDDRTGRARANLLRDRLEAAKQSLEGQARWAESLPASQIATWTRGEDLRDA